MCTHHLNGQLLLFVVFLIILIIDLNSLDQLALKILGQLLHSYIELILFGENILSIKIFHKYRFFFLLPCLSILLGILRVLLESLILLLLLRLIIPTPSHDWNGDRHMDGRSSLLPGGVPWVTSSQNIGGIIDLLLHFLLFAVIFGIKWLRIDRILVLIILLN